MTEPRHRLFIPAPHRDLTGGEEVIEVQGPDVAAALGAAEARFPGLRARLVEHGRLRPGIVVAVNGAVTPQALRHRLTAPSEIHFVRAAAGG
jgi:molybdopterin converting factor small subunit